MELAESCFNGCVCFSYHQHCFANTIIFLGHHLEMKLKEAIPMSKKHQALLSALSATFPAETVAEWTNMVDTWQEDMSQPNPFEEITLGMQLPYKFTSITDLLAETTQGDVECELLAEEQVKRAQAFEEVGPVHNTTASKFLSIGLDLEHQQ
jgi:hypothetical protein